MASISTAPNISSSPTSSPTNTSAPLTAMMALMFIIGFLTCLNDILVPHLKEVFDLNYTQVMFIQFTFFSAYFVMSLPSGWFISRFGYKKGILAGLATSTCGALLFYPAAALPSYPLFLFGLFTLASGFTLLQVAVNPYASALGKPETAPSRLTLTQAFNSLGTTIAPRLGGAIILPPAILAAAEFAKLSEAQQISYRITQASSVQLPYVIFAGVLVLLFIAIALFKLPVISSVDSEEARNTTISEALKVKRLRYGVLGIFCYVGAEVAIGSLLINFILHLRIFPGMTDAEAAIDAAKFVSFYWGGAMIGRFVGSALLARTPQGVLLGIHALAASLLVAIAIFTGGAVAMWALILVGYCNSIMFPNIFTLAIKDLGILTNRGGSVLTMAIVGGAVIPLAQGALIDVWGFQPSYILPLLCYAYIVFFAFKGWKEA
jgi:FHS family L-fucose permease-like MFS transporter